MASIRKEIQINARPEDVWAAIRDYGAVHERVGRGFVVGCQLEPGARIVTFANGLTAREVLVDIDDEARRLAYSAVGGRLTHHNSSSQVFPDGEGGTRFVWITDLLPNELAEIVDGMMEVGAQAAKRSLEHQAAPVV